MNLSGHLQANYSSKVVCPCSFEVATPSEAGTKLPFGSGLPPLSLVPVQMCYLDVTVMQALASCTQALARTPYLRAFLGLRTSLILTNNCLKSREALGCTSQPLSAGVLHTETVCEPLDSALLHTLPFPHSPGHTPALTPLMRSPQYLSAHTTPRSPTHTTHAH